MYMIKYLIQVLIYFCNFNVVKACNLIMIQLFYISLSF
jgi:hypothetical protein